jgi:hypothetical protein
MPMALMEVPLGYRYPTFGAVSELVSCIAALSIGANQILSMTNIVRNHKMSTLCEIKIQ